MEQKLYNMLMCKFAYFVYNNTTFACFVFVGGNS